jgi:hypothetical protein
MIQEKEAEFYQRVMDAKQFVFGDFQDFKAHPILLSDSLLDEFSLSAIPLDQRKPVFPIHYRAHIYLYCRWWIAGTN